MIFKVILISIVLLVIAGMGFAIKLFFDKKAMLPSGSCCSSTHEENEFHCECGKRISNE